MTLRQSLALRVHSNARSRQNSLSPFGAKPF